MLHCRKDKIKQCDYLLPVVLMAIGAAIVEAANKRAVKVMNCILIDLFWILYSSKRKVCV